MLQRIAHSGIFVLDQDEALDFYVGKLGMEVRNDVDLGFMRWLTVGVPGDPDREVLLEKPAPPSMSEEAGAQVRDLLTNGALGLALIVATDDCRKTNQELRAKGVVTPGLGVWTHSPASDGKSAPAGVLATMAVGSSGWGVEVTSPDPSGRVGWPGR